MRTEHEIRRRFELTEDDTEERVLAWVLTESDHPCPMCAHPMCRTWEQKIRAGILLPTHLETQQRWPFGTVSDHMEHHRVYDHAQAASIERARSESISTLAVAEDIAQKLVSWIEELEQRKDEEGITSEWVADASRLVGNANSSLRLIGQLKQEIGVDSQLLLAHNRVEGIMGVIVDVLAGEPQLLDKVELRLAALKEPTNIIDITEEEEWFGE
tara:strand:- start:8824 stop:9465 length:642 start_codon:yes stop_codon:yes gene_type:complete